MNDEALRKMNHREWLMQCALVFEQQWREIEMTPFRLGLITRLKMASEYIALLEKEAGELKRESAS